MAIAARYKGYRYPIEVIGHAVWLYHRFALSLRDVEELMVARGVVVTYETIRSWCAKFGPGYADSSVVPLSWWAKGDLNPCPYQAKCWSTCGFAPARSDSVPFVTCGFVFGS